MKRKILIFLVLLSFLIVSFSTVTAQAPPPTVTVTKTVNPTDVCIAGSGGDPEWFEITIEVTGFGGDPTQTDVPIDVVFAIDSSGSMLSNDPSNLRLTAAKTFVDLMLDDHQAGVVSWDDNIDFALPLTYTTATGKTTVKTSIDAVDSSGGTNLNVGLNAAIAALDTNTRVESSVEVIVFLSDGVGTYTPAGSGGPADNAASKGYTIYTIGLSMTPGSQAELDLQDIATATGGTYYSSPDAENLQDIFDEIFEQVIISTAPTDVNVVETTRDYIIDESSFSIIPDSINENLDGTTTIEWEDIEEIAGVGDGVDPFTALETFVVTFMAKCDTVGNNLPVDMDAVPPLSYPEPAVVYKDPSGQDASVPIPQAYINVEECVCEEEHDVEVVSQTVTENEVMPGDLVDIDVTVRNNGPSTKTFDVTLYYDSTEIGTILVVDLAPGEVRVLTFTWDTTGLPLNGYPITAWADSGEVITEFDEQNNWCTMPCKVFVVPELPLGTILASLSMFIALVGYVSFKRHKTK